MSSDLHERATRLVDALEEARARAHTADDGVGCLDRALDALFALSSALDPVVAPVVSAHLRSVCDACVARLDEARAGHPEALVAALTLLRPVTAALAPRLAFRSAPADGLRGSRRPDRGAVHRSTLP